MLSEGETLPDVTLTGADGAPIRLADFRGKPVVVYFYPKDDTPGCTTEAIDFTRLARDFAAAGAVVVGVSKDSVESHAKFRRKHKLKVALGADPDLKMAEAWGVWGEKTLYGRKYMGMERATFLVNAKGVIAQAWRKVKVPGHVEAVLEAAKAP